MGENVNLVTSSESTARAVYRELVRHGLENPAGSRGEIPPANSRHKFMATGDPGNFAQLATRFLGPEVGGVTQIRTVAEHFPTGTLSVINAPGNYKEARICSSPSSARPAHFPGAGLRHPAIWSPLMG